MDLYGDTDSLQRSFDHMRLWKSMKTSCIASIVLGTLASLFGLAEVTKSRLDIVLVILGAYLAIQGIWRLAAPSLKGLILDGIAMIGIGLFAIAAVAMNTYELDAEGRITIAALSLVQTAWGTRRFAAYKHFSGIKGDKPSGRTLRWLGGVVKYINRANPAVFGDVVDIRMDCMGKKTKWSALLCGDRAIFVEGRGSNILAASKADINVEPAGPADTNPIPVTVGIGTKTGTAEIGPECLERIMNWKNGVPDTAYPLLASYIPPLASQRTLRRTAIPEPEADMTRAEYAGFWPRVAAALIDTLVTLTVSVLVAFMLIGVEVLVYEIMLNHSDPDSSISMGIIKASLFLIPLLYYVLMESSRTQATLGKMLLGIKVVDENGKRISLWRAAARYLSKALSWITLAFGFTLVAFTNNKQGLHDTIASTYVLVRPVLKTPFASRY